LPVLSSQQELPELSRGLQAERALRDAFRCEEGGFQAAVSA
jgi:hypothetical protein